MGAISTDQSRLAALRRKVLKAAEQLMDGSPPSPSLDGKSFTSTTGEHALSLYERTVLSEMLLYEAVWRTGQYRLHTLEDAHAAMRSLYRKVNERLPAELRSVFPEPVYDERRYCALFSTIGTFGDNADADNDFGYIYQFFCTPVRKNSLSAVQQANKSSSIREVVTFTQLYTPDWVVEFLLQNATGSGDSYLLDELSKSTNPLELKIIDPACGAGHMLLKALDAMIAHRTARKIPPYNAVLDSIGYNVYGADIDAIGLWITGLAIVVKCFRLLTELPPFNINLALARTESSLGSLDRNWDANHILGQTYDVVITNPPYLGRKLLSRELKLQLKTHYPTCHQDLSAAFIRRGMELLKPNGRLAVITQASVLVLPTYTKLREQLLKEDVLLTIVNAGPGVFPLQNGEKINSALIVAERGQSRQQTVFIDITEQSDKAKVLQDSVQLCNAGRSSESSLITRRSAQSFLEQPNFTIAAESPTSFPQIINSCAPLETRADIRQGLATTDNARFVRWWWEVPQDEIGKRWFPYVKGAGGERWWSPIETVVDWGNNGEAIKEAVNKAYPYLNGKTAWVVKNEQFYFKPGLTFSFVNSKQLALRELPAGCIFDVAGSALFPTNDESAYFLLAYLNSSFAGAIGKLINPTINFQVGDLKRIPVLPFDPKAKQRLAELAEKCVALKKTICIFTETDLHFDPIVMQSKFAGADLHKTWDTRSTEIDDAIRKLASFEQEIDSLVLNALQQQVADETKLADYKRLGMRQIGGRPKVANPIATEREFIHFYLTNHLMVWLGKSNRVTVQDVITGLPKLSLAWLEQQVGSIQEYILGEFNHQHARNHYGKPRLVVEKASDSTVIRRSNMPES